MPSWKKLIREIHRRSLWQVLGIYLLGGWVALQVIQTLTESLGLPEWFPGFAVAVLILGLPVVLATAFVQEGVRAEPETDEGPDQADGTDGTAGAGVDSPTARRLFTWRNATAGGVMAFGLIAVVAAIWAFWLSPEELTGEVAAGAEVVAVLPFNVTGDAQLSGEGMVDLLSSSLDDVGPIRTIAPQTLLARWERVAADGRPELSAMLDIGRQSGAGSVLTGSIVAAGSEVRMDATLHAVTGDQLARAQASGPADDILNVVDDLGLALLQEIWRSRAPIPNLQVSAITTGDMDAIRAYLTGLSLYREFRTREAAEALERAVETDPEFALAHLLLSEVYGWNAAFPGSRAERLRRQRVHVEAAERYSDRLPQRQAGFARIQAMDRGPAYVDSLRAFVSRYPDMPQAWYRLGDVFYHAPIGLEMSGDELMAPFERVVELDPTSRPLSSHLRTLIMGFGDRESFGRYAEAMEGANDPSTPALPGLERAVWETSDPDAAVQILLELPDGFPFDEVAYALAFRSGHPVGDVVEALDGLAARADRDGDLARSLALARARLRRAMGQERAARALDAEAGVPPEGLESYARTAVSVQAGFAPVDQLPAPLLPSTPGDRVEVHFWRAAGAALRGDTLGTAESLDRSRAQASPEEIEQIMTSHEGLRGLATLMAGDTAAGLEAIDRALFHDPAAWNSSGDNVVSEAGAQRRDLSLFPLAAAWAADPESRDRGLRILRKPWIEVPAYQTLARFHIAQALEAAGDTAGAREGYAWFVETLAGADEDAPVQAKVAEARAALGRLGGGS